MVGIEGKYHCVKEGCGPSLRRPAALQGRSKTLAPRTAQTIGKGCWSGLYEHSHVVHLTASHKVCSCGSYSRHNKVVL